MPLLELVVKQFASTIIYLLVCMKQVLLNYESVNYVT